jgi:alkanesulfonate monooxygenase SsuD/methylene tetrahydromethanopterin reductase-like flavin-dependent oxidoreductase (luciferase family)
MAAFGVAIFSTDYSIRPDEIAKAAEERGFDSIFFPELRTSPPAGEHRSRWVENCRRNIPMCTTYSSR